MSALVRHSLIDEILDARRDFARGHTATFEGYRNRADASTGSLDRVVAAR